MRIWVWYPLAEKKLNEIGFEHQQVIEPKDEAETIRKIFDSGLNVMLLHSGDMNLIAVDTGKFQQR